MSVHPYPIVLHYLDVHHYARLLKLQLATYMWPEWPNKKGGYEDVGIVYGLRRLAWGNHIWHVFSVRYNYFDATRELVPVGACIYMPVHLYTVWT